MDADGNDFSQAWKRAVARLESSGATHQQRAFVRLTKPLGLLDGTALLAVPNDLTKEFIEQKMREPLARALSDALGRGVRIAVTVDSSVADERGGAAPAEQDDDGGEPERRGQDRRGASSEQ